MKEDRSILVRIAITLIGYPGTTVRIMSVDFASHMYYLYYRQRHTGA